MTISNTQEFWKVAMFEISSADQNLMSGISKVKSAVLAMDGHVHYI